MLSTDLISAYCRNGKLVPLFIDASSPKLLAFAEQFIGIYGTALEQHLRQTTINEQLTPLLNGADDPRFAKALNKLLLDRCHFSLEESVDYPFQRGRLLDAAAQLFKNGPDLDTPEHFQELVRESLGDSEQIITNLYGDLPENNAITAFDAPTAHELLERYNTGVIQALLLTAESIDITVDTTNPAKLRRLFTYLKFFQLLATIHTADDKTLTMTISGPASILEQTRRYGIQLATFFPAICTMDTWGMTANLAWKGKNCTLAIDQSSALKCPYHNFSAYIPDEIKIFQKNFETSFPEWKIVNDVPFLRGYGPEIIIPDFSFSHRGTRKVIHLELFSRWHRTGLSRRIHWLETHLRNNLVIGVDKSIINDKEINDAINNSTSFEKFGFLYRDFPTIRSLKKLLDERT